MSDTKTNIIHVNKFLHDFDNREPKSREYTRNTTNAYGGNLDDMLSGACSGCLKKCNRDFTQAIYCQNTVSTLLSMSIKGSVIIMHGPIGCGSQNHSQESKLKLALKQRGLDPEEAIWLSSNMSEDDVVLGGEKPLKAAIKKADTLYNPTCIFILNSCAPGVIGDDIEGIIDSVRDETKAILVPLHCPGFMAKVFTSAYDVVYHGVLRNFKFTHDDGEFGLDHNSPDYLAQKKELEERKKKTVNIYVASSISAFDEKEMTRLLNKLGLYVRTVIEYNSPEELKDVTNAALNVCLCHVHDIYFVEFLKEKYGMPYVTPSIPIGISSTNSFIRDIAAFFGLEKEAEELIEEESRKVLKAVEPIKNRLQGKTAVVSGGYLRIGSTALLLNDIGIQVLGFRHFNYDEFGNELFKEVRERIGNVTNSVSTQASELVNLLKRLKPYLCITHTGAGVWVEKSGIPTLTLFSENFSYFGYNGVFEVARRVERTLANGKFSRNLKDNVKLPFRKEWYLKDPYHYITDFKQNNTGKSYSEVYAKEENPA